MSIRPITEDDLHAFVDQRLDSQRHAEVETYLQIHPEVAHRIEGYASQRDVLRAALLPIAGEPIPSRLNPSRLAEPRGRPFQLHWTAAAAAVLLTCVGGAGGWLLRGISDPPARGVASLGREAAENYAVYTPDHVHPVELRAASTGELVSWVSERLGRRVEVPDLSASGYRFMGGRVVATPQGPAALFMYDNDHGARLVMLSRPMAIEADAPMQPLSQPGVSGFAWVTAGMGYSLVGPSDVDGLHPIANEVRRQVVRAS